MPTIIAYGDWWRLEDDGTLYVYCTGDMPDYEWSGDTPWSGYSGDIQSAVIQNGVTSIGDCTFSNCQALTDVSMPSSVTSIGNYAFESSGLTNATIGNGVTSIGDNAFAFCQALTDIAIPSGVTSIGEFAFADCESLISVTIPSSVTHLGSNAFSGCSSLASVTVPDPGTADYSWDDVFNYIAPLSSLTISDGVTSISDSAFPYIYFADNATITIPNSVISIGDGAFSECSATSVTIGNSLASIGDGAFYGCQTLASVTIPSSVTNIGESAFDDCDALADIYYGGTEMQWGAIEVGDYNEPLENATVHCNYSPPASILESIAITTPPTQTTYTVGEIFNPTGMVVTAAYSDASTAAVTNYTTSPATALAVSDTVITVRYTENGVTRSATVAIIVTASTIIASGDWWTFYDTGLLDIACVGSMPYQGHGYAPWYDYRTQITSAVIRDSVTDIGDDTFLDCTNLTSVTIPDSVIRIGSYAFHNCENLTSVTIPDSVTRIYIGAFSCCSHLDSVTIPDGVTRIEDYTFEGCSLRNGVIIPESVTSIGDYAFYNCAGLSSVTIPDGVTSIGSYAFSRSSLHDGVTIPKSVTSIGRNAFAAYHLFHVYYSGFAYDWERVVPNPNEIFSDTLAIMHFIPPVLHVGGSLYGTGIINAQFTFSMLDLADLSYTQSLSMDGNEVQSDELYAEIHVEQDPETWLSQWADVSRTVPVWRTRYGTDGDTIYGHKTVTVVEGLEKYYFKSLKRVSRTNFLLTAQSPVGRLTADYPGGLYEGRQAETLSGILADIMGSVPHSIDERLGNLRVYGWLPYQSRRECVHMLALACGFLVRRDDNHDLFFTLPGSEPRVFGACIFNGGSVDYRIGSACAGVEVTEYTFLPTPNDKEVTLFDNTNGSPAAVEQTVRFSEAPVYDITASEGLTVHWANVNAAVVSGIGVLTGKAYTVVNSVLSVPGSNPNADPDSILSVDNVPLITNMNSENVAQKYLSSVNAPVVEMDFIRCGENTGDCVSFEDPYGAVRTGYLLSMSGRVTSLERVTGTFLTGYAPVWGNTYNDVILLTDSGEWTVPASLDGETVRVVLISGGQGGASGQHGSDDTASGCGHGSPGDGGRVNIVKTAVHAGEVFAYHCGAGGDGGVPSGDTTVTVYVSPAGTRYHLKSDCDSESGTLTPVTLAEAVERGLTPCDACVNAEDTRKATQYVSNAGSVGEATTFGDFSSGDGASIPTGYRDMIHGEQYADPGPDNGIDGGKATTGRENGNRMNPDYTDIERYTVTVPWRTVETGFQRYSGEAGRGRYRYQTGDDAFNDWAYGGLGGGAAVGEDGENGYDAPAVSSSADRGGDGGNGADAHAIFPDDTRVYGAGGSGGHGGGEGGHGGTGHSTVGSWARDGNRGTGGAGSRGQAGKAGCILIYFHG